MAQTTVMGNALLSRQNLMTLNTPCRAPLGQNKRNSAFMAHTAHDVKRAASSWMQKAAIGCTSGSTRQTQTLGKENGGVQILDKKGDVVVWGPSGQNTRLPRIICYGDSNTAGFCNNGSHFQPYGQSLASELMDAGVPCEVAVCGLSTFSTEDMLNDRLSELVRTPVGPSGRGLQLMLEKDGPADLVLIMTGTNDLGLSQSLPTIIQNVAQLHSICHERGVPTIAIAPTQGSGKKCRMLRQQLASALAKWAGTATGVIDCLDVEDLLPRPVGKDGASNNPAAAVHWEHDDLHLSAAGSVALGRQLAPRAASWLKDLAANPRNLAKVASMHTPVAGAGGHTSSGGVPRKLQASPLHSARSSAKPAAVPLQALPMQSPRSSGGCSIAMAGRQVPHRSLAPSFQRTLRSPRCR